MDKQAPGGGNPRPPAELVVESVAVIKRKISGCRKENGMTELTSMMNIGKEMARKLDSVGIGSAEELVRLGAEQAFLKVKERYPNVCLVHLYALEGAVCNVEFNSLLEGRKKELKEFSDFLKG